MTTSKSEGKGALLGVPGEPQKQAKEGRSMSSSIRVHLSTSYLVLQWCWDSDAGTGNRERTEGGKTEISVLLSPRESARRPKSAFRTLTSCAHLVTLRQDGTRGALGGGIVHHGILKAKSERVSGFQKLREIQKRNKKQEEGK